MSWRTVFVGNEARLSKCDNQLQVVQQSGTAQIAFEDIAVIVLDSPQITLTSTCLQAVAQYKIALINCDEKHLPQGVFHSLHTHSRQLEASLMQIDALKPLKKRLWQKIIQAKILNQSLVLRTLGLHDADLLKSLSTQVDSGDSKNIEAYAANRYFAAFFGGSFYRSDESNVINGALNYGYSIVRSAIARSIVTYGFLPFFGIHHHNKLNPFNLADDFIEPWRPMIDQRVLTKVPQEEIDQSYRHYLAGSLGATCLMDNKQHTLLTGIDHMIKSFRSALVSKNAGELKVPLLLV